MGEKNLVYPHCGIPLTIIKEQTVHTPNNVDGSPENYAEWKSQLQKDFYTDSIYIIFLKWQKYRNGENINISVGLRRE